MIGVGPEAVLRSLARSLADEAAAHSLDDGVRRGAELVSRIAAVTKVKARDVRSWSQQLKIAITATSRLYDKIAFEFGMTRITGRSKEVEESFERAVDAAFLQERIAWSNAPCRRRPHAWRRRCARRDRGELRDPRASMGSLPVTRARTAQSR